MTHHPRAKRNRVATSVGVALGLVAMYFGYLHPDNEKLWGGFLVGCALFLQLDGLVQFGNVVVNGITAFMGGKTKPVDPEPDTPTEETPTP